MRSSILKDPEKYRRLGARDPKGVLLAGAPLRPGRFDRQTWSIRRITRDVWKSSRCTRARCLSRPTSISSSSLAQLPA
jgi:hypothetical protein